MGRPVSIGQRPDFDIAPEAIRAGRQHLVDLFGKPTKALAFSQPEGAGGLRAVEVALFGESPAPYVLGTAGASALPCADGARREWVLILKRPPADGLFGFLAGLASSGSGTGVVLETADLKPFSAALLLDARALPADKRAFRRKDGLAVELGWAIPVFPEESRYVKSHGPESLFLHWQSVRPDLANLQRKPALPSA